MSQRKGLHSLLEIPLFYNVVQKLFSHKRTEFHRQRLIGVNRSGFVLDVGCGPGTSSSYFRNAKGYVGIDISEAYVAKAASVYGTFGEFRVLSAVDVDQLEYEDFDLVLLNGVFHHLSDEELELFLSKITKKLSNDGIVVSVDPTFLDSRGVANFIAAQDRGMHVRSQKEMLDITGKYLAAEEVLTVKQSFPPYQRLMLKLGKSHKNEVAGF